MSRTSKEGAEFGELFVDSIQEGLVTALGIDGARSVTFFLDPHIAVADPEIYEVFVTRLLGAKNEALFNTILDRLLQKTGVVRGEQKEFKDDIAEIRRKFETRSPLAV